MASPTRKASTRYNPFLGCPPGYKRRGAYTHKISGRRIPALCIRTASSSGKHPVATTPAAEPTPRKCPPGYILRKGYIRKFRHSIRKKGYTVHRKEGRTYRIFPKKADEVKVKAACVKEPTQFEEVELQRGQLRKYGYQYREPEQLRRAALKKAVQEYTPAGVYRILATAARKARKEKPAATKVFSDDRDWIHDTYNLTASLVRPRSA